MIPEPEPGQRDQRAEPGLHGVHRAGQRPDVRRHPRARVVQHPLQVRHQRIGRIRALQHPQRPLPPLFAHPHHRQLLDRLDRVQQILAVRELARPLDLTDDQEERNEEAVDDRRRRLEEVVVVRSDELADLVDEQAQADAAQDRGHPPRRRHDERQQDAQRDQHQQAAPEQVRDVQAVAADLRVVRQVELGAHDQHRGDRAEHHRLQELRDVGPPRRHPPGRILRHRHGGHSGVLAARIRRATLDQLHRSTQARRAASRSSARRSSGSDSTSPIRSASSALSPLVNPASCPMPSG